MDKSARVYRNPPIWLCAYISQIDFGHFEGVSTTWNVWSDLWRSFAFVLYAGVLVNIFPNRVPANTHHCTRQVLLQQAGLIKMCRFVKHPVHRQDLGLHPVVENGGIYLLGPLWRLINKNRIHKFKNLTNYFCCIYVRLICTAKLAHICYAENHFERRVPHRIRSLKIRLGIPSSLMRTCAGGV